MRRKSSNALPILDFLHKVMCQTLIYLVTNKDKTMDIMAQIVFNFKLGMTNDELFHLYWNRGQTLDWRCSMHPW
jgi:hypothetical protein